MVNDGNSKSTVIVGAGPAGLAAASKLLDYGAQVTLIDEYATLGGQYFRQYSAAPGVSRSTDLDERYQTGKQLIDRLQHDQLTVLTDTLVWGLFDNNELAIYSNGQTRILHPDSIILATGAIEQVSAFPGWTLPGVMTAGGIQALLSRDGMLPGEKFLVAGTGPLLLAAALEIAEAGGEVAAVVEGSSASAPLRNIHRFLWQMKRIREGWDYRQALEQHGIPFISSSAITAVRGSERVESVTVQEIDADWQPVAGTETDYAVDTVCMNFGFIAAIELARMIDCDIQHDPARGGWYVTHDAMMRTSCPGVYVAGQGAGIGGADLAQATGILAGLAVAADLSLGKSGDLSNQIQEARKAVDRARSVAAVLNSIYSPAPGLASIIQPDTTICRCEEILASEVDEAIAKDATTLNDIKRYTRCGMGACQGRICSPIVSMYLEHKTNNPPEVSGLITARPPVKPVPLGALARLFPDS